MDESEGGARTALEDSAAEHARKGRASDAGNAVEKALNLIEALGGGEPRRLGEIAAAAGVDVRDRSRAAAFACSPAYEAMNSRYARGSAEIVASRIGEILNRLSYPAPGNGHSSTGD